ncbi:type II secretion system F family protein [Methylobacterium nodulans]|uniref:Type II secretion system protein n=1 Tax=Methylobacterium nodulans (strain LMG 21967 / CNCM I-2342 / ORS 2060) TaxID=460265 RepID=B8IRF8_METNO|nr:type II secretion system F family protein [Methylobacterium nodulans]ACL58698.1 type II secretion system protein [Methylobacterium nodulans ORS 2060]
MLLPLLVFFLGAFSTGGLLLAAFHPRLARTSALDRRLQLVRASAGQTTRAAGSDDNRRKRSVQELLRETEQKQKAKNSAKLSLVMRLRQADLGWSKSTYYTICLTVGTLAFLAMWGLMGLGLLPAVGFGLCGGMLLPHLYVSARRKRRFKRFAAEFPNAIDVIVRGVKAGLPLVDCLNIVAAEAQEPVKSEFRALVEDQTLGMPLQDAVERLPERMPLSEARFFAIVIAIQSRTGGSLSEALGNLSRVLRERKKMQGKIKAVSSEAKASAGIIAALPIVVGSLVYLTSPAYMALLFTTPIGKAVLAGCVVWMLLGTLMMRKMINFDF